MRRIFAALLAGSLSCLFVPPASAGPSEVFLAQLKDAMRQNDMAWIGAHLTFPVTIRGKRRLVLRNRQALVNFDPTLIGPRLRADILAERPEDLSMNWQGMMIGSAEHNVWVTDMSADPARPDLRIFAITGAN
jgi:hypothetical protein